VASFVLLPGQGLDCECAFPSSSCPWRLRPADREKQIHPPNATCSEVEHPGNGNAPPANLDLESGEVGKLYMPTYDASPEAPHSSVELRNIVPSISFSHLAGEGEANNIPFSVEENVIERMKVCRLPMCCILPGVLKPVI